MTRGWRLTRWTKTGGGNRAAARAHLAAWLKHAVLAAAISCGCALNGEDARAAFTPLTRGEVLLTIAAELRARGVPGDQLPQIDDIELPAAIPAATGRALRVSAACWNEDLSRAQFRLECREARQCLPFFAYLRGGRPGITLSLIGRSCQASSGPHLARSGSRKAVVRAGDRVTVVYGGRRMRVTAMATCLDRGAEGDIIRVRNQDGHIFRARVSSATLLEALP